MSATQPAHRHGRAPVIAGRSAEQALVAQAVDDADTGAAKLLVLGARGVGKTSLIAFGISLARARGFRTITASGAHGSSMLRHLAESVPARLNRPPGPDADAPALVRLVRAAARTNPLAIVIDDLHHAAPDVVDALAYLGRVLVEERVLLLLAACEASSMKQIADQLPVCLVGPLSPTDTAVPWTAFPARRRAGSGKRSSATSVVTPHTWSTSPLARGPPAHHAKSPCPPGS